MKNTFEKATVIGVEVSIGSGHVAVYKMSSDEYIRLRQENALGLNNCFAKDEDGVARWQARAVNHYRGFPIERARLFPLDMTTKVYPGRWKEFEVKACEAFGADHYGFEYAGKVKGYIPDGVMFGIVSVEFKSKRGKYQKGQAKKTR